MADLYDFIWGIPICCGMDAGRKGYLGILPLWAYMGNTESVSYTHLDVYKRQNGSLMAGQVSGMVKEILPVRTILENMVREYENIR